MVDITPSGISRFINPLCDGCVMCLHDRGHTHSTNQRLCVLPFMVPDKRHHSGVFQVCLEIYSWTELSYMSYIEL